jgi:hypothetical protein
LESVLYVQSQKAQVSLLRAFATPGDSAMLEPCPFRLPALVAVFNVIGSRVNVTFLPIRDCPCFVAGVDGVFLRKSQTEIE